MAKLRNTTNGLVLPLNGSLVLGRSPSCGVVVDDPRVSGEHASLAYRAGRWELRDLASRNGTRVGSRWLEPGERVALVVGVTFSLAGVVGGTFEWLDGEPPPLRARNLETGEVVVAEGGTLVLPDEQRPEVTVFADGGSFLVESAEGTRRLRDGETLEIVGCRWAFECPDETAETLRTSAPLRLESIELRLRPNRTEEHVDVRLALPDGSEFALPPRTHHYVLLVLARLRASEAHLPEPERGWIGRDALCRMLRCDPERLNVDVFRLRKQLTEQGVHGAIGIVERRNTTGELRLGVRRFTLQGDGHHAPSGS